MGVTARDDVPISTAVDGCGRSFLSLAEALRKPSRFADQIAPDSVLDEFDRFKLWAGNIAAHRKGRRSLDYRLRDAAQLKAETNSLLASLEDALNTAMSIAQGHRLPWDEEAFTDSDSDSESSDDGSVHNLQGDTELRQLFARMKSLTTSLMRLSMAIREPAPNRQARSIDKSHFEQHDMWHVQAKFPDAPQYLTERLGRAISSRRQYLTYREVHHDKLKKGIDKLGLEAARTEFTTNSTEATKLQRTETLTIAEDFDDSVSMTSYATSVNATLRAPGLPKEAREQEYYNCPLCFALVSFHTTAAWKRHVYQDLHPYCCTFEDCATADRLYDSRHAWFAHESEAHYSIFQCVEGCSETFRSETGFETHIKASHANLAVSEIYSTLKKSSCRSSSVSETVPCHLCGKRMTRRALQKHMGHHHEQLALFALPPNLDDTEEDGEAEELGSMSGNENVISEEEEEEEEVSDASHASESDEILDEVGVAHTNFNRKRRGNLPKEATNVLREWFAANLASPYPTEDQKMDLCRLTNLTFNQVNNWFINARRRALRNQQPMTSHEDELDVDSDHPQEEIAAEAPLQRPTEIVESAQDDDHAIPEAQQKLGPTSSEPNKFIEKHERAVLDDWSEGVTKMDEEEAAKERKRIIAEYEQAKEKLQSQEAGDREKILLEYEYWQRKNKQHDRHDRAKTQGDSSDSRSENPYEKRVQELIAQRSKEPRTAGIINKNEANDDAAAEAGKREGDRILDEIDLETTLEAKRIIYEYELQKILDAEKEKKEREEMLREIAREIKAREEEDKEALKRSKEERLTELDRLRREDPIERRKFLEASEERLAEERKHLISEREKRLTPSVKKNNIGDAVAYSTLSGQHLEELKAERNLTTERKQAMRANLETDTKRSENPGSQEDPDRSIRLSLSNEVEQRAKEKGKKIAEENNSEAEGSSLLGHTSRSDEIMGNSSFLDVSFDQGARKRRQEAKDREEERKRIIAEADAEREQKRKAEAAGKAALDAHDKLVSADESEAKAELERIIYERQKILGAEKEKTGRERLLREIELEKMTQEEKDKEEYEAFTRKQEEKKAEEAGKREKEEKELEDRMRKRLAQFGFYENQTEAMIHPSELKSEAGKSSGRPLKPTYAKIRREYLDVETLHYYDIPYEYDKDPNYIIVLREMSQQETDILFEHTRRLRSNHGDRLFVEADDRGRLGKKEFSSVRRDSRRKTRKDGPPARPVTIGDMLFTNKVDDNDNGKPASRLEQTTE